MERTDSAVLPGVRTARATPGGGPALPGGATGGREVVRWLQSSGTVMTMLAHLAMVEVAVLFPDGTRERRATRVLSRTDGPAAYGQRVAARSGHAVTPCPRERIPA